MTRHAALAVAAGGVLGATLRWAVFDHVTVGGRFPWATLALNVAGSLVLGIALGLQHSRDEHHVLLRDLLGIGFCGGLTTFSTFAVEVAVLMRSSDAAMAATYATTSVLVALSALLVGAALAGRVQDLGAPLEAEP